MNKSALDKIIKKVVYPKYPYIVDHEIVVYPDDVDVSWGVESPKMYVVDLYVGKNEIEGIDMQELLNNMDKAEELVEHLFELLGFDKKETIRVNYSLNENRE